MSRGRGRSWRPQKQRSARDSRSRSIIFLIALLVILVGALVLPPFFQAPLLRLAIVTPESYDLQALPLTLSPSAAHPTDDSRLKDLFQQLHERNPSRIAEPQTVRSAGDLSRVAERGEKLLLYCALEPEVGWDADTRQSVLQLRIGSDADAIIPFADLLTEIRGIRAGQTVLLMDILQRDTGLANGRLSDDAVRLIESTVSEAKIPGLAVICACARGERNWEHINTSTSDAVEVFAGTVFGAAVRQALVDGETATLNDLFESVRDEVADTVRDRFGATQTVVMFPAAAPQRDNEFLVRVDFPEAPQESPDEAQPPSETPKEEGDGSSVAESASPAPETSQARLTALFARRADLAKSSEVRALNPGEWNELTTALVNARWALLNGDDAYCRVMLTEATRRLDVMEFNLQNGQSSDQSAPFAPWFTVSSRSAEPTPEQLELFGQARDGLTDPEEPRRLPVELRSASPLRSAFVDWLVGELKSTSEVISARPVDQRQQELERLSTFVRQLSNPDLRNNWPQDKWPQELFTIADVVAGDHSAAPGEALVALMELISLRREVLTAATGQLSEDGSFRRQAWNSNQKDLQALLTQLTAIERWLAIGSPGLSQARNQLQDAAGKWSKIRSSIRDEQVLVSIRDRQVTELPQVVQLIAQQQEEDPIIDGELDDAVRAADALIAGSVVSSELFPDGIRGRTGLTSREVRALFHLTRNFDDAPASASDLADDQLLRDYKTAWFSEVRGAGARRMLLFPDSESDLTELAARLQAPGASVETSGKRRTGLWLTFWSLRLLDALAEEDTTNHWQQWKRLAEAVRGNNTEDAMQLRTELAHHLVRSWQTFHSSLQPVPKADLFVAESDAAELLSHDLQERMAADTASRSFYGIIRSDAPYSATSLPASNEQIALTDTSPLMGASGTASVGVTVFGEAVYVSRGNIRLTNAGTETVPGWYRLGSPSDISELQFTTANPITAPEEVIVAVTNASGILCDYQTLTLYPNADANWKLHVYAGDRELIMRDGELKLPPTTFDAEGKDAPLPLTVRLERLSGNAPAAKVVVTSESIRSPSDRQITETVVDFSGGDEVDIPLVPAAAAEGAAAPASAIDVHAGIAFAITPWQNDAAMKGAETSIRRIRPIIADMEEYVLKPAIRYRNRDQSLTIELQRRSNVTTLVPATLPVRFHFSPRLEELLDAESSSPLTLPNLPDESTPLSSTFVFSDRLQQRFGEAELEFGISIAGIPHARRWQLEEDGAVPIAVDTPRVRADLTLQNAAEVSAVPGAPQLLIGPDWLKAKLDVEMHIHGGRFDGSDADYELRLKIARQDSRQAATPVFNAGEILTRRPETIQVAPGKKGAWDFSTDTQVYAKRGLQIASFGLKAGQYRLIAELQPLKDRLEAASHAQEFVFDDSKPPLSGSDIVVPGETRVGAPFAIRIPASDPESGIQTLKIGFSKDKLRPFDVVRSGQYVIKPDFPGFPEIEQTERRETKGVSLFVEVTNAVGLTTLVEKDVRFFQTAKPVPEEPKEEAKGIVKFNYSSSLVYTVTLKSKPGGPEFSEVKKAESPVVFENVPAGSYTLSWDPGVGTGKGSKSVTVKAGETATVAK